MNTMQKVNRERAVWSGCCQWTVVAHLGRGRWRGQRSPGRGAAWRATTLWTRRLRWRTRAGAAAATPSPVALFGRTVVKMETELLRVLKTCSRG
jgi:hypothetical protein